ncbi:unnamed protein product, partial [Ixodes hexagonus]
PPYTFSCASDHTAASCSFEAEERASEEVLSFGAAEAPAPTVAPTPTEAPAPTPKAKAVSARESSWRWHPPTEVADYSGQKSAAPFSMLENGRFHLKGGATVTAEQWKGIYENSRAAKAAKDTAHALWGAEKLVDRTFGGRKAPKDRKNSSATARKELTPEKVTLVVKKKQTVAHWGKIKNVDVTDTVHNMGTILSEKIQDTRKGFRRRGLF